MNTNYFTNAVPMTAEASLSPMSDNFGALFSNEAEFLHFVGETEMKRNRVPFALAGAELLPTMEVDIHNLAECCPVEAFHDIQNDGCLPGFGDNKFSLKTTKTYLFSKQGFKNLLVYLGANAPVVKDLSHEAVCGFVNSIFKELGGSKLAVANVSFGKIRAIHSPKYQPLNPVVLLSRLKEQMEEQLGGVTFHHSVVTHDHLDVMFIAEENQELIDAYTNAVPSTGSFFARLGKIRPIIRMVTSETGQSAVHLTYGMMSENGEVYHMGKAQRIVHKKALNEDDDLFQDLFAWMKDSTEAMENLQNIHIQFASNCIANICLSMKIDRQYIVPALDKFVSFGGTEETNAFEVWLAVSDALIQMKESGSVSLDDGIALDEKLGQILYKKKKFWIQHDLPVKLDA